MARPARMMDNRRGLIDASGEAPALVLHRELLQV